MKRLLTILLAVLLLGSLAVQAADVAVLDSVLAAEFYASIGWPYEVMMDGLIDLFKEAKISFSVISDEDLTNSKKLGEFKVLVLPDNRKMDTAAVDTVLKLVNSGKLKVFGSYQSSFRDAANARVGDGNFQLEEIYDMKYAAWVPGGNLFIGKPEGLKDHPVWNGVPSELELVKADQMSCEWLGIGKPIGIWLDNSLEPLREEDLNVALVETKGAIYCGAWFWYPDNLEEKDFRTFAVNIIKYLLSK